MRENLFKAIQKHLTLNEMQINQEIFWQEMEKYINSHYPDAGIRLRKIMGYLYEPNGTPTGLTFHEVGKIFDIGVSRVGQLHQRAIRIMSNRKRRKLYQMDYTHDQ